MKTAPDAPKDLSTTAKAWWKTLVNDYAIEGNDSAGIFLLEVALRAFDQMRIAEASIVEHGQVSPDKNGQLRPNPSCVILRDSRAAMLSAMKSLNFDLEPKRDKPGRPGGRS